MPSASEESRWMSTPLAHRVAQDADAADIAEAVIAIWHEVDVALTPIVGPLGVVALFRRSLFLSGAALPGLANWRDSVQTTLDPATLRSALLQLGKADAAAAGNTFLQTFYELLASLVGPSLSERLLRSAWANTSGNQAAQDTLP